MKITKVKLAVSLVTYNAEKYLPFCLRALAGQSYKEFSLLIIDNGSSDNTVGLLKENYPQLKVVAHLNNIGFAKAHNQGIAWSNSDYLLLLNQDVILEKDYLREALSYLDKYPDTAALNGKIMVWDFFTNQKTDIIDTLGLKMFKSRRVIDLAQGEKDDGRHNQAEEIFGVSGTAPIYRRVALEKVKINLSTAFKSAEYLDEDFFSYKEDVDLAYRLRLAGYKSIFWPKCLAYHDRSVSGSTIADFKSLRTARKTRNKDIKIYSYKNHFLLLIKNEFLINFLKNLFSIFWYELKKFIYILLFEQSTLKGLSLFWKQKSIILKKRKYIVKNIRKITPRDLAKWFN